MLALGKMQISLGDIIFNLSKLGGITFHRSETSWHPFESSFPMAVSPLPVPLNNKHFWFLCLIGKNPLDIFKQDNFVEIPSEVSAEHEKDIYLSCFLVELCPRYGQVTANEDYWWCLKTGFIEFKIPSAFRLGNKPAKSCLRNMEVWRHMAKM